jgi:membrane protease YdiL (CAAX protease family)
LTDTPDPDPVGDPAGHLVPDPGGPPGRATFSLEGRSAPALYLVGWVGSVLGLGLIVVSFLAAGGAPAPWLFLGGLVLLSLGLLAATGSQALERAHRTDLPYAGPSPVLAFLAVIGVTLIATVAVLAPLAALGLDPQSPVATTISLLITMLAYIGVVRLVVVGPGALTWADMGLHEAPSAAARDLAIGALIAVPVLLVTLLLGGLLARFLQPAPSPLPDVSDSLGLAANLVTAAILAPIGEELFFRGFATTAWARSIGPGQAIIRGAVFFSIAHVVTLFDVDFATGAQRALFSFVVLLPVGIVLGWLFLARRSLYAAIGLHSAFNAIQVVVLLGVAGVGR